MLKAGLLLAPFQAWEYIARRYVPVEDALIKELTGIDPGVTVPGPNDERYWSCRAALEGLTNEGGTGCYYTLQRRLQQVEDPYFDDSTALTIYDGHDEDTQALEWRHLSYGRHLLARSRSFMSGRGQ